jgi:deoxyribonuclease V
VFEPNPKVIPDEKDVYSFWNIFREIQCQLSRVDEGGYNGFISLKDVSLLGGCDTSYSPSATVTSVVTEDLNGNQIEEVIHVDEFSVEYMPSLFMAREAPPILSALKRLTTKPQLLFVNGHGIAHPRKCGLATYIGKVTGIPTIGFAKGLLAGRISEDGRVMMGLEEVVGYYVKGIGGRASFFVSPGFRVKPLDLPKFLVAFSTSGKTGLSYPSVLARAHARSVSEMRRFRSENFQGKYQNGKVSK